MELLTMNVSDSSEDLTMLKVRLRWMTMIFVCIHFAISEGDILYSASSEQAQLLSPGSSQALPVLSEPANRSIFTVAKSPQNESSLYERGFSKVISKVLDGISGGFLAQIGAMVFNKIFGISNPPTLEEIVNGVEEVVKQSLLDQTIQSAQTSLEGITEYFTDTWPWETGPTLHKDLILEAKIQVMQTEVTSVLGHEDCYQGSAWPAYMLAAGLQIQLVQERCKLMNMSYNVVREISHKCAGIAEHCYSTLKARRQEAIKVHLELRELPPESRTRYKTHMMAYVYDDTWPNANYHDFSWACRFHEKDPIEQCPHAKQKYDSIIAAKTQQLEENCDWTKANSCIQQWKTS